MAHFFDRCFTIEEGTAGRKVKRARTALEGTARH
jgi:hypothetical protein